MVTVRDLSGMALVMASEFYFDWMEPKQDEDHLDHDGHHWVRGNLDYLRGRFEFGQWSHDEEIIAGRQELIDAGLIVFERIGHGWFVRPTPALVEFQEDTSEDV